MCSLDKLYNEISTKKFVEFLGQKYEIKNCIIAMDDKILKVSAQLVSEDSKITVFTELTNFSKLRNEEDNVR